MSKKWCWVATQTRKGWRLALCIGSKDYPIRGVRFKTESDVAKVVGVGKTVYVHLADA